MKIKRKIILKVLILNIALSSSLISASLSPTEITKMVKEIKKERIGISLIELESTVNPFIIYVPKKQEEVEEAEILQILAPIEVVYTLKAILNKAAFIDRKWYKQGDTLGDYKVGHVSFNSVLLESTIQGNRTLSLKKKNKSFIKSNRGYK